MKIDTKDVTKRYEKGRGKGGQKVNKCESCVILTHNPTGISVRIDGRSRERNEKEAWEVLKKRLQDQKNNKFQKDLKENRQNQIGLGFRGEKRRTYRVKDDLVIDHISGEKASLTEVYKGKINLLH